MKKKSETAGEEPRIEKEEKGGKKRKFGPVKTSLCIVTAAAIAAAGTWACIAFLRPQQRNNVSEDYGSTVIEVQEGERFSPDAFVPLKERDENEVALSEEDGTYDAVDIYGRLNWTFGQQQNWYSEMHSEVQTAVGIQNVETYKRYSDGILISSDITTSSLVNDAREFCYVGDRVIWRESDESKDKWDGLNTSFSEGTPAGNMPISGEDGFKKRNGLPATELSVYVIRSSTVESAELELPDTASLADGGLYTVTYHLIPKTDETGSTGAAAYYGNQMVFSGGIDAPPTFNYITVSFTFTEDWLPVSCTVEESYTAAMKTIVSTCTSTSLTEYTYGVPELQGEVEEIYENYYKQYADSAATGEGERELTATDCLAGAFSPILSGPSCLDLDLTIDGKQVGGNVYLDLGGALEGDFSGLTVRAKLGDTLALYVEGGVAYVNYGNVKLSMGVSDLVGLFATESAAAEDGTEGTSSTDDLLARLVEGEFTHDETHARLHSLLPLGDIEADITFDFNVDENKNVTLGGIDAVLELGGEPLHIHAAFCENGPAPLTDAQKAEYADAGAAASYLKEVISSGLLRLDLSYTNESLGLALQGTLDLAIADGFALHGAFMLTTGGGTKEIGVAYDGSSVYVNVDGIKVKATVTELVSFLVQLLPSGDMGGDMGGLGLSALLGSLFDTKFAENFTSAEAGDVLRLTLGGTQILRALGVEFDLGDLTLELGDDGCSLSALGAKLTLQKGEAFTVDTEGYAEVVPYALNLYQLFSYGNVAIDLAYQNEAAGLSVGGQIIVDTTNAVAVATLDIGYGQVEKQLTVTYQGNTVYLNLDGLKLKANVTEIANILSSALPQGETDLTGILGAVLSLNFSKIIPELKNGKGTLEMQLALDELLQGLGVDLSLGTANIVVSRSGLDITADGLTIGVTRAEHAPVLADDLDSYVELAPAVKTVADILGGGFIKATVDYQGEFELAGQIDLDITSFKAKVDLTVSYQGAEKSIHGYFVNDGNIYLDVDGLKVSVAIEDISSILAMIPVATEETLSPVETLLSQIGQLLQAEETENGLRFTVALDNILAAFGITLNVGRTEIVIDDTSINISTLDGALSANITAGEAFITETEGYAEVLPYVMGLYEMFLNENVSIELAYYNQGIGLSLDGQIIIDTTNAVAVATLDIGYGAVEKTLTVTYQGNTVYLNLDGLKLKANVNEIANILASALPQGETDLSGILGAVLSLNFSKIIPELKNGKGTLEMQLALDELLQGLGVDLSLGTAQVRVTDRALSLDTGALYLYMTKAKAAPVPAKDLDSYADIAPFASAIGGLLAEGYLRAELSYRGDITVEGTVDIDLGGLNISAALELGLGEAQKTVRIAFLHAENLVYLDVDGIKIGATTDELCELIEAFTASDGDTLAPVETLLKNFGAIVKAEKTESGAATLVIALDDLLSAFGTDVAAELGTLEISAETDKIILSAADGAFNMALSAGERFAVNTEDYVEILPYVLAIKDLLSRETLKIALGFEGSGVSLAGDICLDLTAGEGEPVAVASLDLVYGAVEREIGLTYLGNTVYLSFGGLGIRANIGELASLLPAGGGDVLSILKGLLSVDFSDLIPALVGGEGSLQMKLALDKLVAALGFPLDGFRLGTAEVTVSEGTVALSLGGLEATVTEADAMPKTTIEEENFTDIAPLATTLISLLADNYLSAALSFETGGLAIEGEVRLDVSKLVVEADLTLAYGGAEKDFTVAYVGDGMLYVTVDGFRLKADIDAAMELISSLTKETKGDLSPVESLLENLEDIVDFKSSDGTFEMTVALEDILKMFGIDLATGDAIITADGETLTATAFGGNLTLDVTRGQKFTVTTGGYMEIVTYIKDVLGLLSSDAVDAAVSLTLGDISVEGTLTVETESYNIYGDLTLTGPDFGLDLGLALIPEEKNILNGTLYADVNGLKLKGSLNDIAVLVPEILNIVGMGAGSVSLPDLETLLPLLLSVDLREHISLMEVVGGGSRALTVTLSGTELIAAILPDLGLDLGDISIRLSDGELGLSMQNGDVKVTAGRAAPDIDETAYADIGPIMQMAEAILLEKSLTAEVNYRGAVTVAGSAALSFGDASGLRLSAALHVGEGENAVPVGLCYGGDTLYLDLGDAKFTAKTEAFGELLSSLPSGSVDMAAVGELLKNLKDIVDFSTSDGVPTADVALSKILQAFGVNTDLLAKVTLSVKENTLTLSLLENALTVAVTAGGEVAAPEDTEKYSDIAPLVTFAQGAMEQKGIALATEESMTLCLGEEQIDLCLENAGITWKDGFAFRGDIVLSAFSSAHRISVRVTKEQVQLAYGNIGATIKFAEFGKIGNAFAAVKTTISNYIKDILGTTPDNAEEEVGSALALAESGEALSGLVGAITSLVGSMTDNDGNFDVTKFLGGLKIANSVEDHGILHLAYDGISLDLTCDGEKLSLALSLTHTTPAEGEKEAQTIRLIGGKLTATAFDGELAQMPSEAEVHYLGTEDFVSVIGYLGSAVDLIFGKTDYTFTIKDKDGKTVYTDSEPNSETETARYTFNASVQYHRGDKFPIHIVAEEQNLWVDSDLFLRVSVNITATNARTNDTNRDKNLYLDLFFLDLPVTTETGEEKGDGNLDCFVSVSQFAKDAKEYSPLCLYAPASEIMQILSGVVSLFGVDAQFINEWLIKRYLSPVSVDQLRSLGTSLLPRLFGRDGEPEPTDTPSASEETPKKELPEKVYIKDFAISEKEAVLTLNSNDVYGKAVNDLTVTITRDDGNFASVKFENVYNSKGTEVTQFTGTFVYPEKVAAVNPLTLEGNHIKVEGIGELILSLVNSATHKNPNASEPSDDIMSGEQEPNYIVNNNFYIDGSIEADLLGITKLTVNVAISVTIDDNNDLSVNIHLQYNEKEGLPDVISGRSTVDITIKNSMVYMKRVQENWYKKASWNDLDFGWKEYETPVTLYRAMPLDNFLGDILNQLIFLLNFGDLVANPIKNAASKEKEETVFDYGAYLKSFTYKPEQKNGDEVTAGAKWDVTVNGDAIAKGVLGDLSISLAEDADGFIHNLTVNTSIVSIIHANATLRWRNPGGVMEKNKDGITIVDVTNKALAEEADDNYHGMGAMIEKLNEIPDGEENNGWGDPATPDAAEGPVFLEAKPFTVTYKYNNYGGGTTQLGTQTVMVSTGADGYPEYTLYTALKYPDLPDNGKEFYVDNMDLRGAEVGKVLPADTFYAQQYKHTYTVKFWSPEEIDDTWKFDTTSHKWWNTFDMEYGAKVIFKAKGDEFGEAYTVTNDNAQEVTLPQKPAFADDMDVESRWTASLNPKGTEFSVLYNINTVHYISTIEYTIAGNETPYTNGYSGQFTGNSCDLITPTATEAGYTFLGWYQRKTDGSWEHLTSVSKQEEDPMIDITVEALWVSNLSVKITRVERSDEKGTIKKQYQYSVEAVVSGGILRGAFAEEVNTQTTYSFEAYTAPNWTQWSEIVDPIGTEQTVQDYVTNISAQTSGRISSCDEVRVFVTVSFSYGDIFNYTIPQATAVSSDWTNV